MPNSTRSGKNRKSAFSIWVRALQAVTGPWTKHNLFSWVGILFVVFFIKGCIVDQYTIPTGSMEPTLIGNPRFFRGDRVLVNKCLFGPRIPFTTKRLWHWGNPERWDIVVFHAIAPDAKHPILVKRVVGLPGEKIHIRDGKIWINGEVVTPPEPLVDVLHYTDAVTIDASEIKRQFLLLAQRNQALPSLDPYNFNVQLLYTEMEKIHST
ncbi:MAG: signal peptidase I, partial [Candidatus Hydrogenedentes bacterium]|nr:signal peptidase I [Candidatus Hydrogenedentota bacterium]